MLLKTLKRNYEKAVNAYVDTFLSKQFDCDVESYWVGDDVGGILAINDYFISFNDIRTDIDSNVKKGVYFEYYDYSLDVYEYLKINMNYSSYISGLRFNNLESIKKMTDDLKNSIKEENEKYNEEEDFVGKQHKKS